MSETSGSGTPAGWLADPTRRHEVRYWNGTAWTDDVADNGVATKDPIAPGEQTAPAVSAAPPAAPRWGPPARGIVGRRTSPGKQILLTIVTLGIWAIVWVYRQHEDIKQYSGDGVGGWLGVVIYVVIAPVTPFLLANEVQTKLYERAGERSPVETIIGLWILLPIIGSVVWYLRVQRALNDFWAARGAPEPS
jgi:hypothetical protein